MRNRIRIVSVLIFAMTACLATDSAIVHADPESPTEAAPQDTAIGKFFNRLFRDVNRPAEPPANSSSTDSAPQVEEAERIIKDAIDDRAAAGRQQQRDLLKANRLAAEGDNGAAVDLFQRLLNSPEDTLILTDEGEWKSLQQTVEGTIGGGTAELQTTYRERFAAEAQEQLRLARQSSEPRLYAQVAKRYLHTPAGRQAARILARLSLDCGESMEADYWSQRAQTNADSKSAQTSRPFPSRKDWLQPYGGPRHLGRFAKTDPVLIDRWQQSLAVRSTVVDQVDQLIADLVDNGQACIPAAMPLAIGNRIIVRTLRGLSAYDAQTGRLAWEAAEGASVERLISGEEVPQFGGDGDSEGSRAIPKYSGANPDGHPLSALLFQDGVYGLISSDGEQVFVLEDHATLSFRQPGYFWGQRIREDPYGRDWSTNQLAAYDLESGRVRWRIGGESLDEPFDLPLAGTLFLGPPVVDGDELFLIGEHHSGTISLLVLDRRTGELQWSHAISETDADIQHDLVRRWWAAQPAVGSGVIICPTTAGWLVAIDRLQHRIRWTYRYIEDRQPKVSSNRSRVASAGPLNSRWCHAAPIMTQRYVVFTPPELPDPLHGEQPRIVCVDALTGERRWRHDKDTGLYLGAVDQNRVVVVGQDSVEARDLANGKTLWKTRLTDPPTVNEGHGEWTTTGQRPSGRGIVMGDSYLLPLQSGELLTINLDDGGVTRRIELLNDDRPLGNLILHQGRLVSLEPTRLRSFEDREAIDSEQVADSSTTASASTQLRLAEFQYVEGDWSAARQTLQNLISRNLTNAERQTSEQLLWHALLAIVRHDLAAADAEFDELKQLAASDEQQVVVQRTHADRLLARGEELAAFEVYWTAAQTPQQRMIDEGPVRVRWDRWLSGRLGGVYGTASANDRMVIDNMISSTVADVIAADAAPLQWWSEVLRFHSSSIQIRRLLAERLLTAGDSVSAEIVLRQLIESGSGTVASSDVDARQWAGEQLVKLLVEQGRFNDADVSLRHLPLNDANLAELRRSHSQALETSGSFLPHWSMGPWQVTRSTATYQRAMFEPVLARDAGLPSIQQLKLRIEPNMHRLNVSTLTGERIWETPLQPQSHSFFNHTTGVTSVGPLLLVVYRGTLHAISPGEKSLLWSREFDVQSSSGGYVREPTIVTQRELRSQSGFLIREGLRQQWNPMGMLAVWHPEYVAFFGRNSLTVADPLTGKTFWTRRGIPPDTIVHGNVQTLYVIPPAPANSHAVNVSDGSTVPISRLDSLTRAAVGVSDQGLILAETDRGFPLFGWGKPSVKLRCVRPIDRSQTWSLEFDEQTRFTRLNDDEILTVSEDGNVQLVNLQRGSLHTLGAVDAQILEDTERVFAVIEQDRIYVAFNKSPRSGAYSRSHQSSPVNGTLAVFHRTQGLLWQQSIEDQNLIIDQFAHLPVLLFSSLRPERNGDVTSQQIFLQVRDKESGETLLDEERYITGGNIREMEIDHRRQFIDLKTYSDRLRIEAGIEIENADQ